MLMYYTSKEQLIIEFKKLLLEQQIRQKEVAERLGITPQSFTKMINKQNFSFNDMQRLLSVVDYQLLVDFVPAANQNNEIM